MSIQARLRQPIKADICDDGSLGPLNRERLEAADRIAELEAMLGELVAKFNPEPAIPALTLWDRAAAVLANRT